MKLIVVCLALVAAVSAQSNYGQYSPFNPFNQYNGYNQYNRYNQYNQNKYYHPRISTEDRNAVILKFEKDLQSDGTYNYSYETSNGIAAQEQGTPRNFGGNPPVVPVVAQGSFSWTSPEGEPIQISYIADENGYQPFGSALPTPPPVPPQIARALAYTAAAHRGLPSRQ